MVTISVNYEGELRCTAEHGPSSRVLPTDAPVDNMGRGESFSPTDLVATALATCAVTTMAIVAQREEIPFGGATARIEKHMVADPKRRIGALPMTISVTGELTEEQRQTLENAARNCPVALSIRGEIEAPVSFEYSS